VGTFFSGDSSASPERLAGIQVSTSMMGQVIPYVAGRNRVPFNLIWYGDFSSSPNSSGGKGGQPPSSYTYRASFIAALCLGPIQGVGQVWQDKSLVTLSYENLALALGSAAFLGSISGTTLTVSKLLGGSMYIGQTITGPGVSAGTQLTAGSGSSWTVNISQTVAAGTQMRGNQPVWAGYPSGTPALQQIPYDGIAYVASQDYVLGTSADMPDLTFEVEGCVPGFDDAGGIYDADPSAVVVDYLTDPVHGAAFQGSIASLQGNTNTYQAYCMSLGLVLSPYESNQRSATDFIQEIMQCTNSDIVLSCGNLRVVPYADTAVSGSFAGQSWSYTPDLTPIYIFTDSDYCPKPGEEPVKLTRKPTTDTYNIVNLTYYDRSNYYNPAPASASDNYDISIRGPKAMSTLDFQEITQASVAKTVAQLILQFQLYERNTYEFTVRPDYCLLEPMDYIAINDSGLGLVDQVCRITEVDLDGDGNFTIKAMEVPGTVRNTPQYNWDASQGYYANFSATPLSVEPPAIFQMPPISQLATNGITLGIAVCGQASDENWGGCDVYCSVDGGNTYQAVGTVGQKGPARYGVTTAAIGAGSAQPDTSSVLSVSLADANEQLSTTVTDADAASMQTLLLVGSGGAAEVMSYGSGALVSAGNYNLTYLYRGLYGSTNQTHASGSAFVRLDGSIFELVIDPGMAGEEIYFKFCSFNMVGRSAQDISSVTAYTYMVPGNALLGAAQLIARGNASLTPAGLLYKSTAAAAGWDSDCVSSKAYSSLSVSAQYGGGITGIGFVTAVPALPTTLQVGASVQFCLYASPAGTWEIYEGATLINSYGAAHAGDVVLLTYDGAYVRYYLNGVELRTTSPNSLGYELPATGYSFYVGFALYSPGAVWSDVQTGPLTAVTPTQWLTTNYATVSDNNAQKQGGTAAWDSAVFSIEGYPTCHVSAKPNSVSTHEMVGLASAANVAALAAYSGTSIYTLLNYAWYCSAGAWYIEEGGTDVGEFNGSSSGTATKDVATITYDGSTVTYYLNGISQRTVSVSGLTLFGAAALFEAGCGFNSLAFGPTTNLKVNDTAELGTNAATEVYTQSFSAGAGHSASNLNSGLAVGPYPYAVTVVVTTTGFATWPTTGGCDLSWSNLMVIGSTDTYGKNVSQIVNEDANSSGGGATCASEDTFTLPAGDSATFYVNAQSLPTTGIDSPTFSGVIKCEVIKR